MKRTLEIAAQAWGKYAFLAPDAVSVQELQVDLRDFHQLPSIPPEFSEVRRGDQGLGEAPDYRFAFGDSEALALYGTCKGMMLKELYLWRAQPDYREMERFGEFMNVLGLRYGLELWDREGGLQLDISDRAAVLAWLANVASETPLETRIMADTDWREGALHGKPRKGHPEGRVIFHIRDVLDNVDRLSADYVPGWREQLRLITLIHDTFKSKVDGSRAKTGENHHAMIARRFAERFPIPPYILDIIETHDNSYHAWKYGKATRDWKRSIAHVEDLLGRLGPYAPLFYLFYRCDNETGDKDQTPIRWFEDVAGDRIRS